MDTKKIDEAFVAKLLKINEDHFNDVKSKRIAPAKLQETFVAFANSDGGDIYIGIEDKKFQGDRLGGFSEQEEANAIISTLLEETTPSVENVFIDFFETPKSGLILHISIPKSPKVHYTASGDCYIRVNAGKKKIKGERVTQLAYSKGAEPYENKAVENIEIQDLIDDNLIRYYLDRIESSLDERTFLKKQRLFAKKGANSYPNVGAVLLFDSEPQATLSTRCAVKVYRLRTTDEQYKREQLQEMPKTINGNIESVITKTIKQVADYINCASFVSNGKTVKLIYPAEALKEILVNSVIHRDYSLNDDIHVRIFDNRVEVESPGKLPGFMTLENLYDDRFSRNPNLVRLLHNLPNPVNHDIGEGLDTVKNELRKAGLIEPIFQEKENSFLVTIKHQKISSIEDVIIKYFDENPKSFITNKIVRQLSGEDDMQKVKKALQKLRAEGVIRLRDDNVAAFKYEYIKNI